MKGPCKKNILKPVYYYPSKNVLYGVGGRAKCWVDTHYHCIYTGIFWKSNLHKMMSKSSYCKKSCRHTSVFDWLNLKISIIITLMQTRIYKF